jgi:site-specific DNA-cytosine methylase
VHATPQCYRFSKPDAPAYTLTELGTRGQRGGNVLEWPWEQPSTTVTTRGAIPPPGHHPEEGSILSRPGVVLLSERAAALLQGFPLDWKFVGKTKKARWGQIGMAMPMPSQLAARCRARRSRSA